MKQDFKRAKYFVCASCEYVFKHYDGIDEQGCPICGFAYYTAHYVFGKKAYKYYRTQEPFLRNIVDRFEYYLENIDKFNVIKFTFERGKGLFFELE